MHQLPMSEKHNDSFSKYSWKQEGSLLRLEPMQAEHFRDMLVSQADKTKAVTKESEDVLHMQHPLYEVPEVH